MQNFSSLTDTIKNKNGLLKCAANNLVNKANQPKRPVKQPIYITDQIYKITLCEAFLKKLSTGHNWNTKHNVCHNTFTCGHMLTYADPCGHMLTYADLILKINRNS